MRRGELSSVAGQRHTDATAFVNLVFLASHLRKNARTKYRSRTTVENHEWRSNAQTSQVHKERPLLDPSREFPLASAALFHCKLCAHVCGGIGVGEGSRHGMTWVPRSLEPGGTSIKNNQILNKINEKHATGTTRNYSAVLQRDGGEIWMVNGV